jgi:hypothetical protein
VVIVCTTTEPSACVEVDSLVITVGAGVEYWVVVGGGIVVVVVVSGSEVDIIVHEVPYNVFSTALVTSTVRVKGTCTVDVAPRWRVQSKT